MLTRRKERRVEAGGDLHAGAGKRPGFLTATNGEDPTILLPSSCLLGSGHIYVKHTFSIRACQNKNLENIAFPLEVACRELVTR